MSDTPGGQGWWQATDGKWYPPQAAQAAPPPPGQQQWQQLPPAKKKSGAGKGCLIALAVVGGLFVLLIVVAVIAGGGSDDNASDSGSGGGGGATATTAASAAEGGGNDPNPGALFADRPDQQSEDQEVEIGGEARLSGYTAVVNSAAFEQQVSEFENTGYIHINVTITNRDDTAQPYNLFDWRLQTPGGTVVDPTIVSVPVLDAGDLVAGGSVTGDVYFDASGPGDYFVLYKPDPIDAARGIWKVTAP